MPQSPSKYLKTFFTSQPSLLNHFSERAVQRRKFRAAGDFVRWRKAARRTLWNLLGLRHFKRCAPKARRLSIEKLDVIVREKWLMQTETGNWMPFYLLIPANLKGPRPLVLCPHGHLGGGKWATAGRYDIPAMRPVIKKFRYDYGMQFARAGFVAACPDARGFGERREPGYQHDRKNPELLFTESCYQLLLTGASLGMTVQGMWTWDLMRLLDFLLTDRRIDRKRIGCAGLSGGGLQTLNLAALDSRIQAAVVSGYFYGVKDSLLKTSQNCMCNVVPHLWEHFDMGDIAALIVPRALFIETGDEDHLNGASKVKNVEGQVRIARTAYRLLGVQEKMCWQVFHGGHRWNGEASIPWMQRMLKTDVTVAVRKIHG